MRILKLALSLGLRAGLKPALPGFIFDVNTANAGTLSTQFQLPLVSSGAISMKVKWGDGNSDTITSYNQAETLHTYASSGTYTIEIINEVRGFKFNNAGDKAKILDVSNWGEFNLTDDSTFFGCSNLTSSAVDIPTISSLSLSKVFESCTIFNSDVSSWNVSSVTDMSSMFRYCQSFNQDISSWNTSNVTDMSNMFLGCLIFNQDISSWNTGSVTNMSYMFANCLAFDQDLSGWNTGSVTDMSSMLANCLVFDQDISSWNISQVANLFNFLINGTLSTINYDALLVGWDSQVVLSGLSFNAGNSIYTNCTGTAFEARQSLMNTDSWTILDGGGYPTSCFWNTEDVNWNDLNRNWNE
jgi:surface protein